MAEPTPEKIRQWCDFLLPTLDNHYGEYFKLGEIPGRRSAEIGDFYVVGSQSGKIPVQHKMTFQDQEKEIREPKEDTEFRLALRDWLEPMFGDEPNGLHIITELSPPPGKRDRPKYVEKIGNLIMMKVFEANRDPVPLFSYRREERLLLTGLPESLKELEVYRMEIPGLVMGGGRTYTPKMDPAQGIRATVEAAKLKYGTQRRGVILLLEPAMESLCLFYDTEVRKTALDEGPESFMDIWILNERDSSASCLTSDLPPSGPGE